MMTDWEEGVIRKRNIVSGMRNFWQDIFGHSHSLSRPSRRNNNNEYNGYSNDLEGDQDEDGVIPLQSLRLITKRDENGNLYGVSLEGMYVNEVRWPTSNGDVIQSVVRSLSIPIPQYYLSVVEQASDVEQPMQSTQPALPPPDTSTTQEPDNLAEPTTSPPTGLLSKLPPKIRFTDRTANDDKRRVEEKPETLNAMAMRK